MGMESYDVFAPFYDAVQGDRAEHARYLRSLIEKHHPNAKTVLELGCGTGSILKHLHPQYEVAGVDLSAKMLELAAEKMPAARLFHEDMRHFSLGETFDVVLCVYDSINHLLTFEHWEALFDRAREHLNDGGVFVFDINTEHKLAAFVAQPPWTLWFGDSNLLVMDVTDGRDAVSVWALRVFEHLEDSHYRLHSEDIAEVSFTVDRIKASLRERYRRVWTYDAQRSRPTSRSERLHFVCRR
jgi:cyclopropane fatty-acyl-phospholipid synthase-like methyltransferase